MDGAALEPQVQEVGRALADALPNATRGPLRVLDDRAMEFASSDAELRAALFRFVDVVPACRSLDDLARHLTGFLEDVDDPPPSIDAAMRMGSTRVGRAALGAAAAERAAGFTASRVIPQVEAAYELALTHARGRRREAVAA